MKKQIVAGALSLSMILTPTIPVWAAEALDEQSNTGIIENTAFALNAEDAENYGISLLSEEEVAEFVPMEVLDTNYYNPSETGFFWNTNGGNVTVDEDGWINVVSNANTTENEQKYANFMSLPLNGIEPGKTYKISYEVKDLVVTDAAGNPTDKTTNIYILSSDQVSQFLANLNALGKANGDKASGSVITTAKDVNADTSGASKLGLRSFATVSPDMKVSFKIKLTVQEVNYNGNLYSFTLSSKGEGVSMDDNGVIHIDAVRNGDDSQQYQNFFTAPSKNIEDGEYYTVSYFIKPAEVIGAPSILIQSTQEGAYTSQFASNPSTIAKYLTEEDTSKTFGGSFMVMGQHNADGTANGMLRSFAILPEGAALKADIGFKVTKLDSYPISFSEGITAERVTYTGSNKAPAGEKVSYKITSDDNLIVKVTA